MGRHPRVNELTLIVPLRGRTPFTRRWLDYAETERLPFKILLADGSADDDAEAHRRMAAPSAHPHLDLEYRRYPHDSSLPVFYAKLADASAGVTTPFAAIVDNDDFPVVHGLERCVSFLRGHQDFVACGGLIAGMTLEEDGRTRFEPRKDLGSIDAPTAAERLRRHFADYQVTWYDPARAEVLAAVLAEHARRDLRDVFLAEHLASHLLVARGPVRKIPDLMLVRQYDAPGSTASIARAGGALARMLAPTWSEDFSRFTEALAAALADAGTPLEEGRALVRDGYRAYIEKGLRRPAPRPDSRLRRVLRSGLRTAGLGSRVARAKDARWAGTEGARALARISGFLADESRRTA